MNANGKHVAKAVEASDWLYSDEGSELMRWGPEGLGWVWEEKSPWKRGLIVNITGYPEDKSREEGNRIWAQEGGFGGTAPWRMEPRVIWGKSSMVFYFDPLDPESEKNYWDIHVKNNWLNAGLWIGTPEPKILFTDEEFEEKIQLETQLNTFVDEEGVKMIHGKRSFDEWDDFVKKLEQMGAKRLEEIYKGALDRFVEMTGHKF